MSGLVDDQWFHFRNHDPTHDRMSSNGAAATNLHLVMFELDTKMQIHAFEIQRPLWCREWKMFVKASYSFFVVVISGFNRFGCFGVQAVVRKL